LRAVRMGRRSEEDVGEAGAEWGGFGEGDEVAVAADAVDDKAGERDADDVSASIGFDKIRPCRLN
jgi:hypothetical protein